MNYLDERIIVNITLKYPSLGDRLYRYDVAIDNEWDNPVFIGNCFIGADVPKKTIDITDIVRNYYDFSYPYNDTEFQREWQVRIWLDKDELEHSYSDTIGIYPIYRYPNRKARMETPLSNNGLNWVMPALQGFNADKKGEFLPHIPFIYSDKVDYNLAVNIGNLRDDNPYLYTGVKKHLSLPADFGIFNTQYKLSELWKGTEVETLDWEFAALGDHISLATGSTYSFTYLAPLSYKAYVYTVPAVIYDDGSQAKQTPITTFPFTFDAENTGESQEYPIDLYILDADANELLNIYPEVDKSCKVSVHCEIKEDFANDYTLITTATGEVTQTEDYWFIDSPGITQLDITLRDENDAVVKTLTVSQGDETFSILDTEGITQFEFSANGVNYDFELDARCSAGNGAEYIFTFTLDGTNVKIYPIISQYKVDATFRTYRVLDTPLETSSITIQNDGNDNLTTSDRIRFVQNKQNLEVVYGNQQFSYPATGRQITSAFLNPVWSYALVDKTGKLHSYNTLSASNTFPVVEGDFVLYIFAINGANYEVTKITTKGFGIAKGFNLQFLSNNKSVLLLGWTAALNYYSEYKQYVASKNIIEVAKVDACPARYYLQWRDRYGSMQMQSFNPTIQYKQDFSRLETKNYRETRKLSNLSIQPKWTLNTGFLSDYKYPYYESLLVSPWIKLYDTQEDCIYDVIIKTTDYTEKTYLNQDANLFNLEIEVEQTDKQNILY